MFGQKFIFEEWWQKNRFLVSLIFGLLLIWMSFQLYKGVEPIVQQSFNSHPPTTVDPDSMLNHANTYYWWGRYRKNTLPEFDTAASWASKSLVLAKAKWLQDKDTASYRRRVQLANQIIKKSKEQAEICKYNIASYVPTYMEIMGYDDDYMHEDADSEDVPNIALRGALDRLTGLILPDRNLAIASRADFVLLNVQTSNPMAEEMLLQELNNNTRMYTIANHEIAGILGRDSINIQELIKDSVAMNKIATSFGTSELSVIDFKENDKVNGIYYYGMKLRVWGQAQGWKNQSTYTEYMVRDRVFNQVTVLIVKLLLVVLMLGLALNLISIAITGLNIGLKEINPFYLVLCCVIALITQYSLVTFGLKNFVNPTPDAYFVSDPGEQWAIAFPLTFILPSFVVYLVLGKMDNFIASFRSDFENPLALFSLVAGSLLPVAFSFTYFNIIRFGFDQTDYSIFTLVILIVSISIFIAIHWSRIVNFPEKIHLLVRATTWLAFVGYVFFAFQFISTLLFAFNSETLFSWLGRTFLPVAFFIELMNVLSRQYTKTIKEKASQVGDKQTPPDGIDELQLEENSGLQQIIWQGKKHASLYVMARRGMLAKETVEHHLNLDQFDCVVVDFSQQTEAGKEVHYFPFAKAFEERMAYIKFNDVAETARKTSNVLGKIISAITSAGGILIDEGKTKPRAPKEVAKMLMEKLGKKQAVLLLNHVEKIDEENMLLLEELIQLFKNPTALGKSVQFTPLLVTCGFGEFGYKDKVIALMGRLKSEGVEKGVAEFEMKYKHAAEDFFKKQNLPIQVEQHLEQLFSKENRDYAPKIVEQSYEELIKKGLLKKASDNIDSLMLMAIDEVDRLPDINIGEGIDAAVKDNKELKELLIAAAYIADDKAKFQLPVLAHVIGMNRMELLHHLKDAEHFNLVYDLKEAVNFYWYAFTDKGLVADFKELENPRQEQVSQLANEYYRGFVEFYCPSQDIKSSIEQLHLMIGSNKISIDILMLIAKRARLVSPAFPELAFSINNFAAIEGARNGVARFDEALECANEACEIYKSLSVSEKELLSLQHVELMKLKFLLLIETGKHNTNDMNDLCVLIQKHSSENEQSAIDKQSFVLKQIRLCFTRFDNKKNDQKNGEDYCAELLKGDLSVIMRLRVLFYQIKLIPSFRLIHGKDEAWPKTAIEVNSKYKQLIVDIENEDLSNQDVKELYREVLNDYAGSFLTDKMLSLFDPQNDKSTDEKVLQLLNALGKSTADELFAEINSLLTKRVYLELEESKRVGSAFSKAVLIELLNNPEPTIDKRGLCYTINYFSRACRLVNDENLALEMAEISVAFNKSVGDKTGACIASGTAGYACMALGRENEAFMWFRSSFGFGWSINHFSRFTMAMHMMLVARKLDNEKLIHEALFYVNQVELLATHPYFIKSSSINDEYALSLLKSSKQLEKEYKDKVSVQLGEDLGISATGFLNKSHEIIKQLSVQKEQAGEISFVWNESRAAMNFSWIRKVWNEKPSYFNSIEWTLQETGKDLNITLKSDCIDGTDEWFIGQMIVKNAVS
jgi:hypothetical protein